MREGIDTVSPRRGRRKRKEKCVKKANLSAKNVEQKKGDE